MSVPPQRMRPMVIIPTYNEHDNLEPLVGAVLAVDPAIQVLVVDDNSPDGTGDLAQQLARDTGRVDVLRRPGKLGLGSAYVAGFAFALAHGYTHMGEMDADGSHRPEDLGRLLAAANDADVVIGSRNVPGGRTEGWALPRQLISKGGSLYARVILRLRMKDCTSGFKCFRREVLETLDLAAVRSNGFGFQVEMNYLCQQAGFRLVEVPIVFPDRLVGRSKMSGRIFLGALALVWQLRLRPAPAARLARLPGTGASREASPDVPISLAFSGISAGKYPLEERYSAKRGHLAKPESRDDLPRKAVVDDNPLESHSGMKEAMLVWPTRRGWEDNTP